MVARSPFGQGAAWPVVQTVQRNGQCAVVIAPAPALSSAVAELSRTIGATDRSELGVVGSMAVELFETTDGNSRGQRAGNAPAQLRSLDDGRRRTSQFEQHLRAVLDYPLGDTSPIAPVTVMANVLGAPEAPEMTMDERVHHLFARMPDAKIHLYGKGERKDRKIGHVNIVGGAGSIDDPITLPQFGNAPSAQHIGFRCSLDRRMGCTR